MGVFEIKIAIDRFYVGQTGKNLEKRTKKHKYSVRTGQESSTVFCHARDKNHVIFDRLGL